MQPRRRQRTGEDGRVKEEEEQSTAITNQPQLFPVMLYQM